jgi:dihydroflavonol-4-reductase
MKNAGADPARLEIRQLDLLSDTGWRDAVAGCRFVVHVASPFVTTAPKDPEELIRPAVHGTRRALEAALDSGAERVVVTSSLAAVQHADAGKDHVFTASDWTDPDKRGIGAYAASKVRAERAAWEIVEQRGAHDRLAVINPGTVLGPLLTDDPGTSVSAIRQIMAGAQPAIPDLRMPWVHVNDVVETHVEAMTSPLASGKRTIVANDSISLAEVASVLRDRLPRASAKVPRRTMPTWLTWAASVFEPQLRSNRALIGAARRFDRKPAEALLNHTLRPTPDAIEETGRSLVERGLV